MFLCQTFVLEEYKFGVFMAATNARVQLNAVITTVNSTHITVGGAKVAKINKTAYKK